MGSVAVSRCAGSEQLLGRSVFRFGSVRGLMDCGREGAAIGCVCGKPLLRSIDLSLSGGLGSMDYFLNGCCICGKDGLLRTEAGCNTVISCGESTGNEIVRTSCGVGGCTR